MTLSDIWNKHKTLIIVLLAVAAFYLLFMRVQPLSLAKSESYSAGSGMMMDYVSSSSRNTMYYTTPSVSEDAYYPEQDRKLKETAYVNLEVSSQLYDNAKLSLDGIEGKYDGYYTAKNEQKNTYGSKEYRTYSLTLKVPVANFDAAVADLRNVADLKSMNINMDDMTTQYYDTKAYLDNYKKEKAKLEELYDRAEEIEDVIKVQERLSQVQTMIDRYQMQLNNIERVTDYSTLYVTLSEKRDAVESYYEMTGLKELWRNIKMSFDNVFVMISNLIGFVIVFALVYFGYKGVRKLIRK